MADNSTIQRNQSNWPAQYQYVLSAYGKSIVCNPEPLEWQEARLQLNRRWHEGGVFNQFMVDTLTFVGNGAAFLSDIFDQYEIDAVCELTVKKLELDTLNYINFPTKYSIKFHSYKTVKVGNHHIGVQISLMHSSILQKFDDRKTITLDLTKRESIGGMQLKEFDNFPSHSRLKIPALKSFLNGKMNGGFELTESELERNGYNSYISILENPLYAVVGGYNSIPISKLSGEFSEMERVNYVYGQSLPTTIDPFFEQSNEERTLVIDYTICINVTNPKTVGGEAYRLYFLHEKVDGTTEERTIIEFGSNKAVRFFKSQGRADTFGQRLGAKTFNVSEGDSIKLVLFSETPGPFQGWNAYFVNSEILISQEVIETPERYVEGLPLYEAFSRFSQLILDDQDAFHSDTLTNDHLYYALITSGVNLRGLSISDKSAGINIDFETFFKSISNAHYLGYAIELIDGKYKLRVEDRDYFFNDTVILDLSDRIGKLDIAKEYIPEMAYVEFLLGYTNYIYESANGRGEYNTGATRTSQINSPEKLDLKSELNASTMSIANCLNKPIETTGSEDIEEDGQVFILKSQRDSHTDYEWKAELSENISIEEDSSLFKESSLNLYYTPTRNFIRNAGLYTPALLKKQNSKLKFQTTNKYQTLKTTGEGYTITENEDILVSNLPSPKVRPILCRVECLFTNADLRLLMTRGDDGVMNYYKKIKLSDSISGWIYGDIDKKLNEDKATISIILANE